MLPFGQLLCLALLAPAGDEAPPEDPPPDIPDRRTIVVAEPKGEESDPARAASVVTREDLDERLPRSAPDAIRYEPGVYVQQTAHSQASPYVRGVTGQQTVIYFDGVRLNNSTFRQGPNQYFFTVDSRTLDRLEVLRGSASTRYGSDAIGGALLSEPIEPGSRFDDERSVAERGSAFTLHPRLMMSTGTADGEIGGRAQIDATAWDRVGVLGGVGYRDVGNLKSGGRFREPATGDLQTIPPLYAEDGKTQLGTGFREFTADTRLAFQASEQHRLTAAYYDYRQFDAPRTDKCPEPGEQLDGCLTYLEQFRTLTYLGWDLKKGGVAAESGRARLSYQNQHELRLDTKGGLSSSETLGRDDVHTVGFRAELRTKRFTPHKRVGLRLDYGVDGYLDVIDSAAWTRFTDTQVVAAQPRGQYLDGSRYLTSGVWAQGEAEFWEKVGVRVGGRGALVLAHAPGQESSESQGVDRVWGAGVANGGLRYSPWKFLSIVGNVDQGFRAPNLDDLTSRQKTGPGFQKESPDLDPERSLSLEGGVKVRHPFVQVDAFVFRTTIRDLIVRTPISIDDCPAGDEECANVATRFTLANADDAALLWGVEGGLSLFLPADLVARGTVNWTHGEANTTLGTGPSRVPISRVPPFNGTAEAGWRSRKYGVYVMGVLRWARLQDRLAPTDEGDPRIPEGGTPGFAVFDMRAGYRFDPYTVVGLVVENLGDSAYRYHGSSINGPGRSARVNLEFGF